MLIDLTIRPNEIKGEETRRARTFWKKYLPYTAAYIGAYTYCGRMQIDNGVEFEANSNRIYYNLQIGKYNSIGKDLKCIFARNHDYKNISTGAVQLMLKEENIEIKGKSSFNNKGQIIIQNDVWFGENVTIMPGTIVRNGAVIARNSHVVSDVPPYAIVGGNPARLIGYRYSPEWIDKLQKISWWDWENEKIVKNAAYFTDDVETFCNIFYEDARQEFQKYACRREIKEDIYFTFVDYYENYSIFSKVLEDFLDANIADNSKKLLMFIQEDDRVGKIDDRLYNQLNIIVKEIDDDPTILCSVEIVKGSIGEAKECFLNCSHYITTRTYDTVYFSCLADQLGMEVISGVDTVIQFKKTNNMRKPS